MEPKTARETASPFLVKIKGWIIQLGPLILRLICRFYLLLVRCTGEGIHAALQVLFGMIREVIKIVLVFSARVLSDICFTAALIVEKIVTAILHLLLQLVIKGGSFINQTARGLVDIAGYGISSAVFITITVFISWFIVPVFQEISHAIMHLFD